VLEIIRNAAAFAEAEDYDLAQTSFSNGLITQLALTEAVNKLDEARIGFENAVYEYFAAHYDWEVATGEAG
jgi:outer membrane protein TolC